VKAVRKQIKRLLLLSGTPAPNSLLELWPQMWLVDPEALGRTLSAYRDAFFQPDKRNGPQIYTWKLRPGAEEQIYARCAPHMMSLAPGDYPDIPERIDMDMPVALPERARIAYQTITHDLVLGNTSAGSAAVLMGKLRQIASGRCYDDDGNVEHYHDEKFEALAEILEKADGPVLVFYDYQHTREELVRRFGFRTDLDVKAWQRGEVTRMALHPASAGHGIDGLQEVDAPIVVVWVDIPWSLELWQQANARSHRQGLRYPVRVIRLVATGTVDALVCDALERKQISQDLLLGAIRRDEHIL
jgi:SNF2 family DNA or RNA helicase